MRTTLLDVLKFAYWLYRARTMRTHLRIGQIVGNFGNSYYLENCRLIELLRAGKS